MEEGGNVMVVVVGAGPSGIAMSACLNHHSIPNIVFERENCSASLWRKRAYDRLHLHLAKKFCSLPYLPHADTTPVFMPKDTFIHYLDGYIAKFNISPRYRHSVESAFYDEELGKWRMEVKDLDNGVVKVFVSEFLVVASGENSEGYIPSLHGLGCFGGKAFHSREYKSGLGFEGKDVLVVGCGNSGMEIAFDLSNYGAHASIVIRSPVHVLDKEMVQIGMLLLEDLQVWEVDNVVTLLAESKYGDLTKYGIYTPKQGPFANKEATGRSPVIDVGTIAKIISGEIKVVPAISMIKENSVVFENGEEQHFDAIIFATGYKNSSNACLKGIGQVANGEEKENNIFPSHWKGEKGLYYAGFSRRGLAGVSHDALAIADDIKMIVKK